MALAGAMLVYQLPVSAQNYSGGWGMMGGGYGPGMMGGGYGPGNHMRGWGGGAGPGAGAGDHGTAPPSRKSTIPAPAPVMANPRTPSGPCPLELPGQHDASSNWTVVSLLAVLVRRGQRPRDVARRLWFVIVQRRLTWSSGSTPSASAAASAPVTDRVRITVSVRSMTTADTHFGLPRPQM